MSSQSIVTAESIPVTYTTRTRGTLIKAVMAIEEIMYYLFYIKTLRYDNIS